MYMNARGMDVWKYRLFPYLLYIHIPYLVFLRRSCKIKANGRLIFTRFIIYLDSFPLIFNAVSFQFIVSAIGLHGLYMLMSMTHGLLCRRIKLSRPDSISVSVVNGLGLTAVVTYL